MNEPDSSKVIGLAIEEKGSAPVLNLLAVSGSKRALGIVTALLGGDAKPAMRKAAVEAAARTQGGAEAIVNLAKEGKLPEDVKLTAAAALRAVQYPSLTNDITSLFPMPSALGGKPLPPVAELAKINGDVAKGRAVFERTESTCVTCHKIGDKGADVGPGLSEIGTKLPKEALYEALLNPNSGLSMGFETNMFTLKDGGAAVGIVRSETKDEIVIALPGGATQKIGKRDGNITKREKLTTSLMPAGITAVLTQDDLVNLVEYLVSLKKK
jgi:putative heme-binding domain-containing protein